MLRKETQKRLIVLCAILLSLLLILLAVVLIVNHANENETTDNGIVICQNDIFAVQKITYDYKGETVTLVRENGMWMLEGEADFPLNQTRLISTSQLCMAYKSGNITFARKVADTCPDLATFGLAEPSLKVTVQTLEKDAQKQEQQVTRTLTFGLSYGDFYYCMLSGDPTLYMIDKSYFDVFAYRKNDLANRDYLPAVEEKMIVDYTYLAGQDESYWVLSDAGIKAIYAHLNTLSFETFADYYATEEELLEFFPQTQVLRIRYYKTANDQKLLPPTVSSFELHLGATQDGGVCFKVWYRNSVYYTTPEFTQTLLSLLEEHNGANALPAVEADRIVAYTYSDGETFYNVTKETGIAAIHEHLKKFNFETAAQGDASLEDRFPKKDGAYLVINYFRTEADKEAATPIATPYVLQFGETETGGVCVRVWYQDKVYYADADFAETLVDLMEQHKDVEEEKKDETEKSE